MKVSILSVFKTAIAIVVFVGLGVVGYTAYTMIPDVVQELAPAVDEQKTRHAKALPGEEVVVEVPKGASLSRVGRLLEEKGVISSRLVFKLVAMIRGEQRKIQAGEYVLKAGSDAGDVLDQLISGRTRTFPLTIPEGYNIYQVASLLDQSGLVGRDDFLTLAGNQDLLRELGIRGPSLEGYLFPDTYFLKTAEKNDPKLLIRRMVKRFRDVYDKHVKPTAEKYQWEMADVVTLASLIEKEARQAEHALVSAVFHNRLRKKMLLQCDPTVIYGIKPMGSKITRKDLQRKHPYNTYQNQGLPPGPIANPGKASLVAAVKPAREDYLYFVAKNDGTHHFSKTLREHINNVNKYQRSRPRREKKPPARESAKRRPVQSSGQQATRGERASRVR